ncbi:MAG TPA: hypothetical protein VFD20_03220, partial [Demequina sp.]|nr:hypothetical protein [Demequina sp.]
MGLKEWAEKNKAGSPEQLAKKEERAEKRADLKADWAANKAKADSTSTFEGITLKPDSIKYKSEGGFAVMVAYRELTRAADPTGHGYAFIWPFKAKPQSGLRVVVPGMDGQAYGIVLRVATAQDGRGVGPLKSIKRLVTKNEFDKAYAKQAAEAVKFWNQVRIAAGLDKGRRAKVSDDFPTIYPADGPAPPTHLRVHSRVQSAPVDALLDCRCRCIRLRHVVGGQALEQGGG